MAEELDHVAEDCPRCEVPGCGYVIRDTAAFSDYPVARPVPCPCGCHEVEEG